MTDLKLTEFVMECRAQRWRGEGQKQMRNTDERIKAESQVWDSGGGPAVQPVAKDKPILLT